MRWKGGLSLFAILTAAFFWIGGGEEAWAQDSENKPVEITMKNVMYHYGPQVAVHIFQLQGELLPVKPNTIVVFDDKNAFDLAIGWGEIAISCGALGEVLNENVFGAADAPIKKLSIESKGGQLAVKGTFHQKADVPFETMGVVSAEPDGRIRLHAEHLKAGHLPVKGVLDLLGIELSGLINLKKVRGVAIDKDDIVIDPQEILPAPHIRGKVSAVQVRGNDIVLQFGAAKEQGLAVKEAGNYIGFRSGVMRFGKLTMHDSDLIMIDMDPGDPFDFYLDHYQEELVAGYTKSTMKYGLRVYTKDYDKLRVRRGKKRN